MFAAFADVPLYPLALPVFWGAVLFFGLAMARHLRVFAASGRYDLGTPYSASDWSLAQLDVPAEVLSRVEHRYYDAGHMMYTRQADLEKLESDLARWLAA